MATDGDQASASSLATAREAFISSFTTTQTSSPPSKPCGLGLVLLLGHGGGPDLIYSLAITQPCPSSRQRHGGELRLWVLFGWWALPLCKFTPLFSFAMQGLSWINPNNNLFGQSVNNGAVMSCARGFVWAGGYFLSAISHRCSVLTCSTASTPTVVRHTPPVFGRLLDATLSDRSGLPCRSRPGAPSPV